MVKFGLSKEADYYAKNIEVNENGSNFIVVMPDKREINILIGFLNKSNSKLYNYRTKFWEKYLEDNHAEDK